jgi:hypothetical protein
VSTWTDDDLHRAGDAEELQISSRRADGALRPYVTIWVVRVGADLYVHSAHGAENGWFRRAKSIATGRIRAGGIERDVAFTNTDPAAHGDIDHAYHSKYDRYGPMIVGSVVGATVAPLTIRLVPANSAASQGSMQTTN